MAFPELASKAWSILLVILLFGGSIFVHELGHFLAAKWRGLKIDRFSIGFGPKIFGWTGKDGIEYWLAWLPLGGYVKLPQLDPSRGFEGDASVHASKLPPLTFSSKVIVAAAGPAFNVLFAFLLGCIVWRIGEPTASALTTTTIAEVLPTIVDENNKPVPSPASLAGLQVGDTVTKVDGRPVHWFGEIVEELAMSSGWGSSGQRQTIFTVQRGEQVLDIPVSPILSGHEKIRKVGFAPVMNLIIGELQPGSLADKSGLKVNDQIVAINGQRVLTDRNASDRLKEKREVTTITVKRDGTEITLDVPRPNPAHNTDLIGIVAWKSQVIFTHPTPLRQVQNAVMKTFRMLASLVNPRSDIGLRHVGSAIAIIDTFYLLAEEGLGYALWFAIIVNVNLAMMNLLPIPVLDGGHILFAIMTKLRGRALPYVLVDNLQRVFVVLLFSFLIFAMFNDVRRKTRSMRPDAADNGAPANNKTPPPKALQRLEPPKP